MQEVSNAQEYFETLSDRFSATGAKGINAIFQFNLTGDDGKLFHVVVNDGTMNALEGPHQAPTVTITMNAPDYVKMSNGKLNGQMAFMTGKLKIAGSIPMAMKLQQVFPPNK